MDIRSRETIMVPLETGTIRGQLSHLYRELVKYSISVRDDFLYGVSKSTIKNVTAWSEVTTDDIEEGQQLLVDDSSNVRLYTRVGDSLYYVALTAA